MKEDVITFEVTRDMLSASYWSNQNCPIALALKAKIPMLEEVGTNFGVRGYDIRIGDTTGFARGQYIFRRILANTVKNGTLKGGTFTIPREPLNTALATIGVAPLPPE